MGKYLTSILVILVLIGVVAWVASVYGPLSTAPMTVGAVPALLLFGWGALVYKRRAVYAENHRRFWMEFALAMAVIALGTGVAAALLLF